MYSGITPADIVNRALDSLGVSDLTFGDIQEGTEAAKPALRAYGPALRQLLRAAHWDFARKQSPMSLLADVTGQTPNVGTTVQAPWAYEYQAPIDMLKARFLPWNSNQQQPNPPLTTGLQQPPLNAVRLQPAPYLVALDYNYPIEVGAASAWNQIPEWWGTEGTGPAQRTVIYTNVPPQPQTNLPTIMPSLVYTALVVYPSQWDSLFEEAMVQYMAQKLAMSIVKDKKLARALRDDAIKIVKDVLSTARAVNANESGYPQTTDHYPDWMRARNQGGGSYGGGFGCGDGWSSPGGGFANWSGLGFSDGSVY